MQVDNLSGFMISQHTVTKRRRSISATWRTASAATNRRRLEPAEFDEREEILPADGPEAGGEFRFERALDEAREFRQEIKPGLLFEFVD